MVKKVALVTGAASGIGAAIATRFQLNGWQVASIDKNRANTDLSIEADVADFKSVSAAVNRIEKELGPIECSISNAGHYEMKSIDQVSNESVQKMFAVHVGGLRNMALSTLP